jgi:phosphopantothenoylcysteine synthetase/decarboxylase
MLSSKTGFESNTNAVDIFFQDGGELSFELMDKSLLGKQLLEALIEKFQ